MTPEEIAKFVVNMPAETAISLNFEIQYTLVQITALYMAAQEHIQTNEASDCKPESWKIYYNYKELSRRIIMSPMYVGIREVLRLSFPNDHISNDWTGWFTIDPNLKKVVASQATLIARHMFPSTNPLDYLLEVESGAKKKLLDLGIKGIFTKDIYEDPVEVFMRTYTK
jgi:hypothetical protein